MRAPRQGVRTVQAQRKMIRKDAREILIDALVQARKVGIMLGARVALTVGLDFNDICPLISRRLGAQRREYDAKLVRITSITNGVHDCEAATASAVGRRAQRKKFTIKLK